MQASFSEPKRQRVRKSLSRLLGVGSHSHSPSFDSTFPHWQTAHLIRSTGLVWRRSWMVISSQVFLQGIRYLVATSLPNTAPEPTGTGACFTSAGVSGCIDLGARWLSSECSASLATIQGRTQLSIQAARLFASSIRIPRGLVHACEASHTSSPRTCQDTAVLNPPSQRIPTVTPNKALETIGVGRFF